MSSNNPRVLNKSKLFFTVQLIHNSILLCFLVYRYDELQNYSHMQEKSLQNCKDLLDEMKSSPEEQGKQEEQCIGIEEDNKEKCSASSMLPIENKNDGCYVYSQEISYIGESVSFANQDQTKTGHRLNTGQPGEQDLTPEVKASLLPVLQPQSQGRRQGTKIPRPPPPRNPGHGFVQTGIALESKNKIFYEKLPDFNKVVFSTGYGKSTGRRAPMYVPKPPVQQQQKHQQSSHDIPHDELMQCDESLVIKRNTIKGIVKPNLIRKDLMNLRDPSARPRGSPKQTAVGITQDVEIRCREQELVLQQQRRDQELVLPRTQPQPQPPKTITKRNLQYQSSQIPTLPTIQLHQGLSGIPRPCALPQPPMMPRSRATASHRRYVARETELPFPRRQ